MAITRSGLRTKIRNELKDWWTDQDAINETGFSATTDTTLTVDDGGKFKKGDIIEIENEILKVTSLSSNNLTVLRGYMGTTAASHSNDTAVYIPNTWTTSEINDAITNAFRALYPYITEPYLGDVKSHGNRHQLDDCDATTGWSALTDATAVSLDSSDYQEGGGSLKLGATYSAGTASYTKTLATTMDATNYHYLNLWVYVENKTDSSEDYYYGPNKFCDVRLGNSSSAYSYYSVGLDEIDDGGWTLLNLPIRDFTASGTWDKTATDYMQIDFSDAQSITSGDLKMDEWFLSTYPMTTNKLKYRLPEGVFRVSDVKIFSDEDSDDYYQENRYMVKNQYLMFREPVDYHEYSDTVRKLSNKQRVASYFPIHKPMLISGYKIPTVPSSDTTTIDLDEMKEEFIVMYASKYLYSRMIGERSKFQKYSAKLNKEDMSVLDVIRGLNKYEETINSLIGQFEETGDAISLDYSD